MEKHRLLLECIAKKETDMGGIDLLKMSKFMIAIGNLCDKNGFDCMVKGLPRDKLDYEPTGNTYEIKTVEDIAKLTPQQFEFFVDDLRKFCSILQTVDALNTVGVKASTKEGMKRVDDGTNISHVKVEANISNKL